MLKSKIADFLVSFPSLAFSNDHNECQIEMSNGAGIQPINAIRKATPAASVGNI